MTSFASTALIGIGFNLVAKLVEFCIPIKVIWRIGCRKMVNQLKGGLVR